MDSTLAKKWVTALRSGDYLQGTDYLCSTEFSEKGTFEIFCCLGVLADIVGIPYDNRKKTKSKDDEWEPGFISSRIYHNDDKETSVDDFPTGQMLLKMGGLEEDVARDLAEMNDHDVSFAEIADCIEKQEIKI